MTLYRVGDTVVFQGQSPDENDRGTVVSFDGDRMSVRWVVAGATYDEDPSDSRIVLVQRDDESEAK